VKFKNIVEHEEHIKMPLKHDITNVIAQKPFSCGGILEVVQNSFKNEIQTLKHYLHVGQF
jgi:hypothetical protein